MRLGMKSFKEVFPPEYNELDYAWRGISELETMFTGESEKPNEGFFFLCLIVDGIKWRFKKTEDFYKGEVYKGYLAALEEQRILATRKPAAGFALQHEWDEKIKSGTLQIEDIEDFKNKIDRQIQIELDCGNEIMLPRSFAEYSGLKRLKYKDGSIPTKKKISELRRIAEEMRKYPYLYYSLSKGQAMFDATDRVVLIPKLIEIDALEPGASVERLVEDDAYIAELRQVVIESDAGALRESITGGREELKKRRQAIAKAVKNRPQSETPQEYVLEKRVDRSIMLGNTILIEPEDYVQIQRDEQGRKELAAIFGRYVREASRPSNKYEGPPRSITENIVDEEKRQELINAVVEFINKMKAELEQSANPEPTEGETAPVTVAPREIDRKNLLADEYWGIVPIRDEDDEPDS